MSFIANRHVFWLRIVLLNWSVETSEKIKLATRDKSIVMLSLR